MRDEWLGHVRATTTHKRTIHCQLCAFEIGIFAIFCVGQIYAIATKQIDLNENARTECGEIERIWII